MCVCVCVCARARASMYACTQIVCPLGEIFPHKIKPKYTTVEKINYFYVYKRYKLS